MPSGIAPTLRGRLSRIAVPALPVLLMVLLPKCPICLAAYLGFFAALGWSVRAASDAVNAILAVAALAAWSIVVRAAGTRRGWKASVLGTLGLAVVVACRYALDAPALAWSGLLLFGAAGWSTLRAPRKPARLLECPLPLSSFRPPACVGSPQFRLLDQRSDSPAP